MARRPALPQIAQAALFLAIGLLLSRHPASSLALGPLLLLRAAGIATGVAAPALLGGILLGLPAGVPRPGPGPPLPWVQTLEGEVRSLPHAKTGALELRVLRLADRPAPEALRQVRLLPPRDEEAVGWPGLDVGDRVRLTARLEHARRLGNPGVRDRAAPVLAFVPSRDAVEVVRRGDGPRAWLGRLRRLAGVRLDRTLERDDAALARALLLGDRSALGDRERDRFRDTGQGHLLAVSGLHVGMLLAGFLFALRRLGLGFVGLHLAGLVLVLLYVPLAGAPPSAVRAGGAAALYFAGRLLRRDASPGALLGGIVLLVLLVDPPSHASLAFALSVCAVVGILVLSRPLASFLVPDTPRIPGIVDPPRARLRRSFAVALAAWLATTPWLLVAFGRIALIAAPLSVATVPLAALLIAGGALTLLAIPGAAWGFAAAADAMRGLLDLALRLGLGAAPVTAPGWPWHVAWVLALGALAAERRRAVPALLVLLGLALIPQPRSIPPWPRLTLLDVGHGQAALLEVPDGRTAMLDAGRVGDPRAGRRIVLPALGALGIRRLDRVIVSHLDSDHVGAVPDLLHAAPVGRLVGPPVAGVRLVAMGRRFGVPVRPAVRPQVLLAGPWGRLEVLAPADRASGGPGRNDDGLVLRLADARGRSVLLPGDIERSGVHALLRLEPTLRTDVLVLPHHGRPGGGRDRLMQATGAATLVASCGESLLRSLPPGTWSTARDGALRIELRPEGTHVENPWPKTPEEYDSPPPMPPTSDPWLAPLLLLVFAALAVRPLGWLGARGALGAWILGSVTWLAFGGAGLLALFAPFVVATLLGKLPGAKREEARTLRQVAANGLPALVGGLVALLGEPAIGMPVLLGGLAFLGADTSATEIGIRYGGTPRSVLTGRKMVRGESGGVSGMGLLGSLGGAALAPLAWHLVHPLPLVTVGVVVFAGAAGALADSAMGASLQWRGRDPASGRVVERRSTTADPLERVAGLRWLDNDVVNLVGGVVSALVAWALVG